jgi:hypothetical protein
MRVPSIAPHVALAVALVCLTPAPLLAQNATPPRTAWGHPDLQGAWTNKTITPFERPQEFGNREFLTPEEAAALERANTADVEERDFRVPDDIVGNYNQHWFDRGTTVVGTRRTSIVVEPRDGKVPPLTPDAQRQAVSPEEAERLEDVRRGRLPIAHWEELDLNDRCILWPTAGPPMLPSAYNNNYQIFQTPEYVAIIIEMIHDIRIIPLDGRPHVGAGLTQWLGDSRGRWEGETLVVETTHFSPKTVIRAANNTRTSDALRVIERFTRVDADTILYRFTIEDPKTWTSSWTGEVPMTRIDERLYEYACHEGNYSLPVMLAGSRAKDEAAARAGGKTDTR